MRTAIALATRNPWPVVVIGLVIGAIAGTALAMLAEPRYTATATLLFRDPGLNQQFFGAPVFQELNSEREAATNVELVSLDVVARSASRALGGSPSANAISDMVSVKPAGQSDVVAIETTTDDPEVASDVANAFARSFIDFRKQADQQRIADARALVENNLAAMTPERRSSPSGTALQRQISRLETLEALQTGNAELVQEATPPSSPSGPSALRSGIAGGLAGLLVGGLLGAALIRLDSRLRTTDEVETAFQLPALTGIPASRRLSRRGDEADPRVEQAFRMLLSRLRYFNVDRSITTILITSPTSGDGKSTTALGLARAAASSDVKTLLVEADFYRPVLAPQCGIPAAPGLAEALTKQVTVASVMHAVPSSNNAQVANDQGFELLPAGQEPPNPTALLQSTELRELVAGFADSYDLVIFDAPPFGAAADAIPLVKTVDGVVVVARLGSTSNAQAQRLKRELDDLGAHALGVAVNMVPSRSLYGAYYRK